VSKTNVHESYNGDWMEKRMLHNGFQYDLNHIVFGLKMKHGTHLPFSRYKHSLHDYGFDPTAAQTLTYQ